MYLAAAFLGSDLEPLAQASAGSSLYDTAGMDRSNGSEVMGSAAVLEATQLCNTRQLRDMLACLGGIGVLLPFVAQVSVHLRALSRPKPCRHTRISSSSGLGVPDTRTELYGTVSRMVASSVWNSQPTKRMDCVLSSAVLCSWISRRRGRRATPAAAAWTRSSC